MSGQASLAREEALASGTISWGDGGCMAIGVGDGSHLIVFPYGTTVDGDDVVLPEGHRVRAGNEIALGGGFHSAESTGNDLGTIPAECLTLEIFWASGEVAE